MCYPVVVAAVTIAQALAANQSQQAATDAQNKQNDNNRKAIAQQQDTDRMEGERQQQQEYERAAAETNQYAKEAHARMASLDTLIGEGGGGVTADRKFSSMGVEQGQDLATIATNSTKQQASIGMNTSAAVTRGAYQSASIMDATGPSALGTALTIAGAAAKYKTDQNALTSIKTR